MRFIILYLEVSREHFKLFTFFNGVFYFCKIIYKIIFMKMLGEYNNNIIYCILWRYFVRSNQLAISVYVVRNIVSLYTIYVREYDIYFKYLPHMQTYTTSSTFAAATNVSIKYTYIRPFSVVVPFSSSLAFCGQLHSISRQSIAPWLASWLSNHVINRCSTVPRLMRAWYKYVHHRTYFTLYTNHI